MKSKSAAGLISVVLFAVTVHGAAIASPINYPYEGVDHWITDTTYCEVSELPFEHDGTNIYGQKYTGKKLTDTPDGIRYPITVYIKGINVKKYNGYHSPTYFKPKKDFDPSPDSANTVCDTGAFYNCDDLKYADLGDMCPIIKTRAFHNCASLEAVRLGETSPDEKLIFLYDKENYWHWEKRPNTCTIEVEAFMNCPKLKTVIIEDMDTDIDYNAFVNCGEMTIYCRSGSAAEKYAKEHERFDGVSCVILPEKSEIEKSGFDAELYKNRVKNIPEYYLNSERMLYLHWLEHKDIFGDVNGNGIVDANDSALVLQRVLSSAFELPIYDIDIADVNADGSLTAADSAEILQKTLVSTYKMPCEM